MLNRCLSQRPPVKATPSEVVIQVSQEGVYEWALELTLLVEDLADKLTVIASNGFKVSLSLLQDGSTAARRLIGAWSGTKAINIEVARTQAEYLQAFVLRSYRDGIAEVNHVHLEGGITGKPFDLTLLFDVARQPMTSDEAAKLLDEE